MDNPSAEFDAEDLALIDAAVREHDAENPDPTVDETGTPLPGAPAPAALAPAPLAAPAPAPALSAPAAPAQAPAAPAQAPAAEAPAAPAQAPAAPAPAPADHHLNAALRIARQQTERLRQENEALKAAQATQAPAAPAVKRPDADSLKDLTDFDPEAVAYMQELERRNQELAAQAAKAPAAPAPAAFVPATYPVETQLVIDAVPELLAMQLNPDQTAFKVAIKQDSILQLLPEWAGKSEAERFEEAARLANTLVKGSATPAPQQPNSGAQPTQAERDAAIAAAQRAAAGNPVAIGDLRGGAQPTNTVPDYTKMRSDEDIMADLDRFA